MAESAPGQGDASTGRKSDGKKPPHPCFDCGKEYTRPHKRLVHMRDCCPDLLEKCPTCGTGYTNEMGVKVHHAREHGESLSKVDVYCEECGDFYKRVYQSSEDHYSTCDDCRWEVKSERMTGENNPQYGTGETIQFTCKYCGEEREQPARNNNRGVFCDAECRNSWLSEEARGEDHPGWKGGKEHYYGPGWSEQREKCLERDDHRCQSCGIPDEEASIGLNAHHIVPYRTFDSDEEANRLDNLVALCIPCHNKWEGIPVAPRLL